ncbi:MAG: D-3-phosphoglycerate dehydrogenase [Marivirga sp.]|jgi:D-3-phosphoglycerate dehydrogenase
MKILIIDKMHESIVPLLANIGCEGDYRPDLKRKEILAIIENYQGLIVRSKTPIDKEFLQHVKHLKFVARAGAGIDNVDVEALNVLGIILLNAPEGNRDAVAEHTMALLLNLFNKINLADTQIRQKTWDREGNRGVELKGKIVGVLGYGYMGQAFAQRLSAFGCRVIVYDLVTIAKEKLAANAVQVDFETFTKEVEILSIHINLNSNNNRLIDNTYLDQFKRLAYLINTSRGEVVVLADLVQFLDEGKIKGAALDVLENEKLSSFSKEENALYERLFTLQQVILSPHVAGWTFESYEKINSVLVEKIKKII